MSLQTRLATLISAIGADIKSLVTGKQDKLVSGTSIKTLNGASLLGSGGLNLLSAPLVVESASATQLSDVPLSALPSKVYTAKGLAVSGNGLVMALGADNSSGYIHILDKVGTTWNLRGSMQGPAPVSNDGVGSAIALSYTGNKLVFSAWQITIGGVSNCGAVYTYTWDGSSWTLAHTIVGTAVNNYLGSGDVSMTPDGNRLIVGSRDDNVTTSGKGTARVYEWVSGGWVQLGGAITAPLYTSTTLFGEGVAITSDGTKVYVGHTNMANPPIFVFEFNGSEWLHTDTITVTAPNNSFIHHLIAVGHDYLFVARYNTLADTYQVAEVYRKASNGTWSVVETIQGSGSYFGSGAAYVKGVFYIGQMAGVFSSCKLFRYAFNTYSSEKSGLLYVEDLKTSLGVDAVETTIANLSATVAGKQDALVSGTNIKTLNGASLLGSGNISISGSGSGLAMLAAVEFKGTGTVTIINAHNVSSITDVATGRYIINFTDPMPDTNYSLVGGTQSNGNVTTLVGDTAIGTDPTNRLTTSIAIRTTTGSGAMDAARACAFIYR